MSIQNTLLRLLRTALQSPQARRAAEQAVRRGIDEIQRRRGGGSGAGGAMHSTSGRNEGYAPTESFDEPAGSASDHAGGASTHSAPSNGPLPDRSGERPVSITYAPSPNGQADPGEVVWAWVPFEEDASKGKDRPVLVISDEGSVLVALMLTSRDRGAGDHTDHHGNRWVDVGTGAWDKQGRPSEVRVDRLLQLRPAEVRREGGRIDEQRFARVAKATRAVFGW